ncbi:MAG: hypothetical protein CMO81_04250 [Waddliaceae bacterium]|nr:hypothetical protein [Waddliaceae bacterium]
MDSAGLHVNLWALGFLCLLFVLFGIGQRFTKPYSQAKYFLSQKGKFLSLNSWRTRFSTSPFYLLIASLFLFSLAFLDPYWSFPLDPQTKEPKEQQEGTETEELPVPTEGIAIYMVLDQSGSMGTPVEYIGSDGKTIRLSRLQVMKEISRLFVEGEKDLGWSGRVNDMIGLVSFARTAQIHSPLTLDHKTLIEQLNKIEVVRRQGDDGTAIGYAIYKTVNLIQASRYFAEELLAPGEAPYTIESSVIILVTDGIQSPNPLDQNHPYRNMGLIEASNYAKEQGVRVYLINIDPAVAAPQYRSLYNELEKTAESTGGRFYVADQSTSLSEIYENIDTLEKSRLPGNRLVELPVAENTELDRSLFEEKHFFQIFLLLGTALFFLSLLTESTVFRRVP